MDMSPEQCVNGIKSATASITRLHEERSELIQQRLLLLDALIDDHGWSFKKVADAIGLSATRVKYLRNKARGNEG